MSALSPIDSNFDAVVLRTNQDMIVNRYNLFDANFNNLIEHRIEFLKKQNYEHNHI